ncbi:MAG: 30S ribosomal protein S13 [Candidatus Omnitrophica bacterium]|nr:30S ribosomal protein S13 [Candidatus Omnitrophota bacterium]
MPRILGIDLPKNKKIKIALTYIYGIGLVRAARVLQTAAIEPEKKAGTLTEEEVSKITSVIQKDLVVEGELKRYVSSNIKRLMDIGSYRGLRHKRGLPARGQRTSSNARTRKGPKRTVGIKRKKS